MTLIDDRSRYTVVCLLRQKSDAAACIKRFVAHVRTPFGRASYVIRSNGGGEYANQELKEFYEQEGIQAQFTAAYFPDRSLQEMVTYMLLDTGMEKRFCGEAVATATDLHNKLPSRAVETTPYELWLGNKPSPDCPKVFGCPAYVHIPDIKRTKLDRKTQRLLFVDYSEDKTAYRFLDPKTNSITISRDARFIELGGVSLASCSPVANDCEQYVEVDIEKESSPNQDEAVVNEPQELAITGESQLEDENHPKNEFDEEFYGCDEGSLRVNTSRIVREIRRDRSKVHGMCLLLYPEASTSSA